MRRDFKVGDTVWCFTNRLWGKVIKISTYKYAAYPVTVDFSYSRSDAGECSFTLDGREFTDRERVLFFDYINIPAKCFVTE